MLYPWTCKIKLNAEICSLRLLEFKKFICSFPPAFLIYYYPLKSRSFVFWNILHIINKRYIIHTNIHTVFFFLASCLTLLCYFFVAIWLICILKDRIALTILCQFSSRYWRLTAIWRFFSKCNFYRKIIYWCLYQKQKNNKKNLKWKVWSYSMKGKVLKNLYFSYTLPTNINVFFGVKST